ncbi:MAG: Uma2 family endonuclease [Micromonosporaceae bacterium]|nr:Uma2 family endonuclease [Micromonosporaceae bacterium]
MRTVVVGQPPRGFEDFLKRRRALGQDLFDEVWGGEYHVVPAPHGRHGEVELELAEILRPLGRRKGLSGRGPCNVGQPHDYRVPDQAYFADRTPQTFHPTAAIVVEVVSPGDETWEKFSFYHEIGVRELLIVDPGKRSVEWFTRGEKKFVRSDHSALLGISAAELASQIHWP